MKKKEIPKILFIYLPILILMLISIFIMPSKYQLRQGIWYDIGIILFILVSFLKKKTIIKSAKYIYIINILLLVYVLLFADPINNSKSWIQFKYFSIEPNELMKISLILIHYYILNSKFKHKLLLVFITFLVPSILTFLEPDTGSLIFYSIITLVTLFYLKLPKKFYIIFFLGILLVVSGGLLTLVFNKNLLIKLFGSNIFYRLDRILSFTNNSSTQLENALISIGAGKTLYFPEFHTDFFFAYIISKNMMLFILIFFSYILIIFYSLFYSNNKYFTFAFLSIFTFQVIYNIGMNLGFLPIMGIPLPFLSYGGSSISSSFFLLALALKNYKH